MKGKSNGSDALTVLEIKRFYLVLYIVCKLHSPLMVVICLCCLLKPCNASQSVVEPVVLCLI